MTPTASPSSLWIRRFGPDPGGARLLCFAHAGGSAGYFRPLAAALAPRVEVAAVQYPGRQDRRAEPCAASIGDLAARIADQLPDLLGRPTAFLGHSMGALVAFETVVELERRNNPSPLMLFASGHRAPVLARPREDGAAQRPDADIINALLALGGSGAHFLQDPELRAMVLPAVRGDTRAVGAYRCAPGTRVSAPITVLTGDADVTTSVEQAGAWDRHTSGAFDLHVFPGGHFYLESQWDAVAAVLAGTIEAATAAAVVGDAVVGADTDG